MAGLLALVGLCVVMGIIGLIAAKRDREASRTNRFDREDD